MTQLTGPQAQLWDFIKLHYAMKLQFPTFREMQYHFGWASTNAVTVHLTALEKKGYVIMTRTGKSRNITVPGLADALTMAVASYFNHYVPKPKIKPRRKRKK